MIASKTCWLFIVIFLLLPALAIHAHTAMAAHEPLDDAQILARIAEGEAEVLGEEGMLAVMHVARNRVKDDRFPDDYEAVSKAFYGRKRREAKPETVTLALWFLTKPQGDDPTGGAIYAYGLADVHWWELPVADVVVPDEPVAGRWQLHLYREIDWVAWRAARQGAVNHGD